MYKQNCLTNAQLRLLLTTDPTDEHDKFLEHLDSCLQCQNHLAMLAGDSAWIQDLQLNDADPSHPDKTKAASQETELANVMDRMSARASTAVTAAMEPGGLSFSGLPFTQTLVAGRKFGPYEIQSKLGTGGMSVVFTAYDHILDRQVAIKFLSAELENSQTARQRFLREAKSAAAVENDFIVPIYTADDVDGFPFLVMSLIEGQSLQQRIDEPSPLSIGQTVRIGTQIAKGLKAFHSRGLVHRDLKPSNILLQKPDDRVRITDFGLAKCTDDNQLTKSGTVLGTPNYMSPEQALGLQVDFRSDIYGLGAILYACVTGRAPFEGPTSLQILNQLRENPPCSILDLKPDTPTWLVQVIERLMTRDPDLRYQNSDEIVEALSQHSELTNPTATGESSKKQLALYATLIITLTLTATYFLWPGNPASDAVSPVVVPTPNPAQNVSQHVTEQADFKITIKTGGKASRTFPTLEDAVTNALSGDIIEIEGDDTHTIDSTIRAEGKPLTIRSLAGSNPVIAISDDDLTCGVLTDTDLVLEGLTFRFGNQDSTSVFRDTKQKAIHCVSGNLKILNCRFDTSNERPGSITCITIANSKQCEIRNSEFYVGPTSTAVDVSISQETELNIVNNLIASGSAFEIAFPLLQASAGKTNVNLDGNALSAVSGLSIELPTQRIPSAASPVPVNSSGNLWNVDFLISLAVQPIKENQMRPELSPKVIQQMMRWHNHESRFRVKQAYVGVRLPKQKIRTMRNLITLNQWNALWDLKESSSIQIQASPRNTNLYLRDPSKLGPKDFVPLLTEQPLAIQKTRFGTQLEFIGPGSAYTNWLLSQTPVE